MSQVESYSIEVVYALPERQFVDATHVPAGTTARGAIQLSRVANEFPDLDTERCPLGIYGQEVADDYLVQDGDRLEIYRPLINDPREIRRTLAASGATMGVHKVGEGE